MITPKTVSRSFVKWMEDNGYGTYATDIFINRIPMNAPDNAFWIVTAGGPGVTSKNITAENKQQFDTQIFYRNVSGDAVEETMFELGQKINACECFTIDGFTIYTINATTPEDNDRDAENRPQASIICSIEIYKSYVSNT